MDFSASITLQADQAHLVVAGDLDVDTAQQLRTQLDGALAQGCTRFTVDGAAWRSSTPPGWGYSSAFAMQPPSLAGPSPLSLPT
jgi:hypothetical protein